MRENVPEVKSAEGIVNTLKTTARQMKIPVFLSEWDFPPLLKMLRRMVVVHAFNPRPERQRQVDL